MTTAPDCVGPHPNPRKPRHALPAGSTDCHCHVFEDQEKYPLVEKRSYTPPLLPLARYLDMCKTIGLERTVQVNASVYGIDNSLTLDIIAELGQHRARGVAGVSPDITKKELTRLNAGGMRGVRLSTHVKGYGGTELIDILAPKVAPLGWHIQLHVGNNTEIADACAAAGTLSIRRVSRRCCASCRDATIAGSRFQAGITARNRARPNTRT
ncbi:MAG: amidohydrolase family protein [Proteobacteria bacterium]|nr:amidohydrolase family protein [Pseudomonadota bacterium]